MSEIYYFILMFYTIEGGAKSPEKYCEDKFGKFLHVFTVQENLLHCIRSNCSSNTHLFQSIGTVFSLF